MLITRCYNTLMLLLFPNLHSSDLNGCPKLFKRDVFQSLGICSTDWFLDPEIMVRATRAGIKVAEVPVVFRTRVHGHSKVRAATIVEFIRNIIRFRLYGKIRADADAQAIERPTEGASR